MDYRKPVLTGVLLFSFTLTGFCQGAVDRGDAFSSDELLEFKLNYGWFTVGRGSFEIEKDVVDYHGDPCYKVVATGHSTGLLKWVAPIEDEWGAIIGVDNLLPRYTFRNLREGKYQLKEEVFINHDKGTLRVESIKPHRKVQIRPTKNFEFDLEAPPHDLTSGLLAIRNINFDYLSQGDTVEIRAFFEDTFYDFQILFAGKEELKTTFGRIWTLKIVPLMPDNTVFNGRKALVAWLSDDRNKLPLKITASMFVGKVSAELIDYQNIKYSLGSK